MNQCILYHDMMMMQQRDSGEDEIKEQNREADIFSDDSTTDGDYSSVKCCVWAGFTGVYFSRMSCHFAVCPFYLFLHYVALLT